MTDVKSIHGHTELAEVPATGDEVLVWDVSAAAHRRVSRVNYLGYTEYIALVTQSGTDAPSATVIKNDTGATVSYGINTTGSYSMTFSSAVLTADKTLVIVSPNSYIRQFGFSIVNTSQINITSANASGIPGNGYYNSTPVIIRIYV